MRGVITIINILVLVFSLVSTSGGFDSNANFKNPNDPKDKSQRDYIRENATKPLGQGGYYGGHDTITAEGMMLKKKVHEGNKTFEDFAEQALSSLRAGAHDEDSTKSLGMYIKSDPPIGINKEGNFYQHFLDPDTGKGLAFFNSALERARDYDRTIRSIMGCKPINKLSEIEQRKIYDNFGRILHLIEDMGIPSHTKADPHVAEPFEKYVNDHWDEIVNSDYFRDGVTVSEYFDGGFDEYNIRDLAKFMKGLAKKSKEYWSDNELYDWVWDSSIQQFKPVPNKERVIENARNLIPETIRHVAGYIDAIYKFMTGPPPERAECEIKSLKLDNPANDHPDDRFDVSDEFYWEKEFGLSEIDLTSFYLRTAIKKGKIGVWYKKRFMEVFIEGRTKYKDAAQEIKDAIEAEFRAVGRKIDERRDRVESDWKGAPDVALFANGFYNPAISLMLKIGEAVSFQKIDFDPAIVRDHPVLLVPTGGFYGLENLATIKALLDEYVKNGGTLVVFTQQRGYDWGLLPTPANPETGEKKPVAGYGYQEDQSCQYNSVYIDTYHPILSVFSTSPANIGVDGYFTSFPDDSLVLLRRRTNGQPAMIIYPYGEGYVIATSLYSDFALTHHQANQTEINLVKNIISWAKKPEMLVEAKPGETINLNLEITNFMDGDTTSIKFTILDPNRKIVKEQIQDFSIPAGQSVTIPVHYTTTSSSPLGIYCIEYTLFDAKGNMIQPQAETDSGRFVVSKPPKSGSEIRQLNFSIQTDSERYLFGSMVTSSVFIFNNSDFERTITAKYDGNNQTLVVPPKGSNSFTYSKKAITRNYHWGHYWDSVMVTFYEGNTYLNTSIRTYWVYQASTDISVKTDKQFYKTGETVTINTILKNNIPVDWQLFIQTNVYGPKYSRIYREEKTINFSRHETTSLPTVLTLPADAAIGNYTIEVIQLSDLGWYRKSHTKFEVTESKISISPNLPLSLIPGMNTIPFHLTNTGYISVSAGNLHVNLKDPDGNIVFSETHPFSLPIGASKDLYITIHISSIRLGDYTLTYHQSDETREGTLNRISIPSMVTISISFDKSSYRVREISKLTLDLFNSGKFITGNLTVAVSSPGLNFTEVRTESLGIDSNSTSLLFEIPIPETASIGQHNVEIAVHLPSGSALTKTTTLLIPESSLGISYLGATNLRVGDTINVTAANTGGVDTSVTYKSTLSMNDMTVFKTTGEENLQAGQAKSYGFQIPTQAVTGTYIFSMEVLDKNTNQKTYLNKNIAVSGLEAELILMTNKELYLFSENIGAFSRIVNQSYGINNGYLHLEIVNRCTWGGIPTSYYLSTWEGTAWVNRATVHYPNTLETRLIDLSPFLPDPAGEYKVRIKHVGDDHAEIDYIRLVANGILYPPDEALNLDTNQPILSSISEGDGWTAYVPNNEIEVRWTGMPASAGILLLMRAQEGDVEYSPCKERVYWQAVFPITQNSNSTLNLSHSVPPLYESGQFYLQGRLYSQTGQLIQHAEHPFHIVEGELALRFYTNKPIYRPGESIHITGDVVNLGWIEATGITVHIYDEMWEKIYDETLNVPFNAIMPFGFTISEGILGVHKLKGILFQNMRILASFEIKYEVDIPALFIAADIPTIAGHEPFPLNITIANQGKVPATVQMSVTGGSLSDIHTILLNPNERRLIEYIQSIHSDTTYAINFSGDLEETITRTVSYGLGASIQFGVGSPELGIFPEGSVDIPVTLTNTGQFTANIEVTYQLNSGAVQQTKTYSLPVGGSITDSLYFNLTEGDYQVTATSQRPDATAQASFSVRKENQAEMAVSLGMQTDGLIPVNINLTNRGYNEINGSVNISVTGSSGQIVWNGEETLSQLTPQTSQLVSFTINPSAIEPGTYTLQSQLLNQSNQVIIARSMEFGIESANVQIIQLPPYQIFHPGEEATFFFKVKNTGSQEGEFDLRLKAYDLIDSSQRGWLKPGEEKTLSFNFVLPDDLEAKDYFASYELRAPRVVGQSRGQIKYHLAGIDLNVNAALDKPYYNEGETAHLTISIQTPNANPQNLFARVNYAGFESQQTFTLSGSQVLIFDIPLTLITGEKLFYGIYHEGGRSIHLNSLYIHKSGDIITITTDKQVYHPGETVSVSVAGIVNGNMTLSGPGEFTESFAFAGSATKNFTLPATIAAGTYFIDAQLSIPDSGLITESYPFDVAGIQVKVLECQNDKGKYASSDTITTTFTISSNITLPALLKAWIVDPTGQYASAGEQNITLLSSENLHVTFNSLLITSVSGVHRLVYGVYGPEELLLCSGSEAFDVGEAVLLSLSTDKRDYPNNTEPVLIRASLFGSGDAELQFELDEIPIKIEMVKVNGFTFYTTQLQNITPGPHTLKAILTAGGLTNTKETSFTYALTFMPRPNISASPAYHYFGSIHVGSSSTQTISLSSTGNSDLMIETIVLSGTNQGEFRIQNDRCSGRTMAPSEVCTLDILFSPASLGTKSASLSIPSNAVHSPALILPVGGAGVTALDVSIHPKGAGRVTGMGIDCPGDCTENFAIPGATIQLTATSTEGYQFTNWTGDINSPENPVTVNMATHKNVTANFAIHTCTITATTSLGGIISPSGLVTVNYGGSQAFMITPNPGYHVAEVKVDGISVGAVLSYTFDNVTSGHTIEVIFSINHYTITATAGPNGAISPSGTIVLNYGESQTFNIIPDSQYRVAEVKVDGISVGPVTTFTFSNIIANHSIEATFEVENIPPVADAGPDQNVITGQLATLNGSESYDPEGAMITFHWTFLKVPEGSSVTDDSLSDINSAKPQFTPDVNGMYLLQMIVNDGTLDSLPDEVVIHATTPNVPPNANAGPDQNVYVGKSVQLDGSMSNDPDHGPQPLSYLWEFVTKPANSLLTDNGITGRNTANPTFIPDVNGLYVLRLIVNDGELSSEDTVHILATFPNGPPNANAGEDFTVYLGETAELDGSASNDPDQGPQPLTYLWSFVTVPTGSQIANEHISGANTASASFTPDVTGTYVLQLMVHDGKDASFDNVAVTVIISKIPPNTSVKLTPLPNASGWHNNDVIVTLNATDQSGSGVKEVTYEASGSQHIPKTTVTGASASMTISIEGQTAVTFFAMDNAGNMEPPKTVLINLDKTAPAISCRAIPNLLWPPNHRMVRVTVTVDINDQGSGPSEFQLISVVSNEPDNGLGDGDQPNDIQGWVIGSPSVTGGLRAERSGQGKGRIYTLTYRASDAAGNHATCIATVVVPHDMRKK